MNLILPILFSCVLLVLNLYIYHTTQEKIAFYKHNPPFHSLDFTNSRNSIYNLLDGDHTTYWKKEKEGGRWDLELELRFSHQLKNDIYIPVYYKELSIVPCEGYPPIGIYAEFFKREGINVDKELRMPADIVLDNFVIQTIKAPLLVDISKYFPDNESKSYAYDGLNMWILGLRARIKSTEGMPCIADISIRK